MNGSPLRWALAIAAVLGTFSTALCGPMDDLLKGVSSQANFAVLINVRGLQRSPMGINRNWAEKRRKDYVGGLTHLPPTVTRVVVAEQLDINSLQPSWRAALIELSEPITPGEVRSRESGTEDKVMGYPVVITPHGRAIVFLKSKLVAEMDAVSRQEIARWINQFTDKSKPTLSPYLQRAAEERKPGAQVSFAIDLSEAFDLEGVRKRLKSSTALQGKRVDFEGLVKTVASTRGVKLSMEVDKEINGEIRVEFGESAEPLHSVGKDLILSAMRAMGAALDDLDSWSGSVEEKAFVLRGKLSERGARMLLSPATARTSGSPYSGVSPGLEPPPNPKAIPSQMYFRSVTSLLDELNKEKKPKTISQRGYWYEQYATKIDALPILNVDQELLDFGAAVSSTLRGMANLGKVAKDANAMIQANQIDHLAVNVGATTFYGGRSAYTPWASAGYGWSWTVPNTVEVSNYRAVGNLCHRNAAVEKTYREATWKNIADATQAIRRKMTTQYKVEF
jgi:hypothetical protein